MSLVLVKLQNGVSTRARGGEDPFSRPLERGESEREG